MKNFILTACASVLANLTMAQNKTYPDLSADYYLWRPEGSTVSNQIKDGKKVTVTDKNGVLEMRYTLGGMQGGGTLTPAWGSEKMCRDQQDYTSVRFCNSGPTSYNWGGQLIEVEKGILVIGDMNYNLSVSGECTQTGLRSISAVLLRDETKKATLTLAALKSKCNELLEKMCAVMKSKTPETKDLRGMAATSANGEGDFAGTKKIAGTYYTYRNADAGADYVYGDCKTAEISDNNDHITINSKFMGVKKINVTFSLDKQLYAIEKTGGHKILRSDAVCDQYKFGNSYLVEIEEGVLVIAKSTDMTWTFESSCACNGNNICYVFFKDKAACSSMAMGEIKTKFTETMTAMCKAYQKTLSAPTSSVAVVLPEQKNTEKELETKAWAAIQSYAKKMGWKETLTGSYVVSAEWMSITKKEYINNSYIDVVKARQKYCIVFFKTDKGIYKSQGFSIQQDAVAGDYSGKNFNAATYVGGILDGLPGSGWNMQIVEQKIADKHKKI
ncbi:MAG: hypothetical protein JNL57_07800 [Bacteroidetes bacterium]|nr:hypothetical protein [Bacteroidota bacterium]